MKYFAILLLYVSYAHACPDFSGTYRQCKFQNGGIVNNMIVSMESVSGGATYLFESVDDNGFPDYYYIHADKVRRSSPGYNNVEVTRTAFCVEDKVGQIDVVEWFDEILRRKFVVKLEYVLEKKDNKLYQYLRKEADGKRELFMLCE